MHNEIRYIVVIHGETFYFTQYEHMKSFIDSEKATCNSVVDRNDMFAHTIENLRSATHIYEINVSEEITDDLFPEL